MGGGGQRGVDAHFKSLEDLCRPHPKQNIVYAPWARASVSGRSTIPFRDEKEKGMPVRTERIQDARVAMLPLRFVLKEGIQELPALERRIPKFGPKLTASRSKGPRLIGAR